MFIGWGTWWLATIWKPLGKISTWILLACQLLRPSWKGQWSGQMGGHSGQYHSILCLSVFHCTLCPLWCFHDCTNQNVYNIALSKVYKLNPVICILFLNTLNTRVLSIFEPKQSNYLHSEMHNMPICALAYLQVNAWWVDWCWKSCNGWCDHLIDMVVQSLYDSVEILLLVVLVLWDQLNNIHVAHILRIILRRLMSINRWCG